MTTFTFDVPPGLYQPTVADELESEERVPQLLRRCHIKERRRNEEEAARLATLPKKRMISIIMPTTMLDRLDQIADSSGSNRSQLIRQIAWDYINQIWASGTAFPGSLVGFRQRPLDRNQDE